MVDATFRHLFEECRGLQIHRKRQIDSTLLALRVCLANLVFAAAVSHLPH